MTEPTPSADGEPLAELFYKAVAGRVVGQRRLAERVLIALVTGGHLLLEGVPGVAKTLAVRTAAEALDLTFRRVQFTPDLLPADIVGTQVYRPETGEFATKRGPVFANVVLADEINRAPAKVQSALLEAMQERQVTLGEVSHPLPEPFLVLATQNPIDHDGTYRLPEAQLDRFLMKVVVGYPDRDEELQILDAAGGSAGRDPVRPVLGVAQIRELQAAVDRVHVAPEVREYLTDIVRATRHPDDYGLELAAPIEWGASPRASLALFRAGKALALLSGRDYVTPGDIKQLAPDVLRHRVRLGYEAEANNVPVETVIRQLLAALPLP